MHREGDASRVLLISAHSVLAKGSSRVRMRGCNHSHVTSRDGVNTVRSFFEHHACRFQEVDQQQNIGKDAYVDLVDDDACITPLCVALQIKAGTSYRTGKGDYAIPVENHGELWRRSTVPVFGIVYPRSRPEPPLA